MTTGSGTPSGTPSAGNIQGPLHVSGYLGDRRKRKKLRKEEPRTLYIHRPVLNGEEIIAWAKEQGFPTTVQSSDLHVTIAFSRAPLLWPPPETKQVCIPDWTNRAVVKFAGGAVVLRIVSQELSERWAELRHRGASWDWPEYAPHITISFAADSVDLTRITPFTGAILLGGEVLAEVNEDWKDTVVEKGSWSEDMMQKIGARHSKKDQQDMQDLHDISVRQGAKCNGHDDDDDMAKQVIDGEPGIVRIAKVDEQLGIVFGYAIVCKVNGEPYYDLNIDLSGKHVGQRVPEHIPEETMLKAATEFMQTARPGNEMHSGTDKGIFVCAFPLTTDIAKAMGIKTNVTGLIVGFKPPPDMLEKFKNGTYKGFSIEGRRIAYAEHE